MTVKRTASKFCNSRWAAVGQLLHAVSLAQIDQVSIASEVQVVFTVNYDITIGVNRYIPVGG